MYDVERMAIDIAMNGGVTQTGEGEYEVVGNGQKERYRVFDKGARASCECRSYVIDGVTKGFICKHIRATIIWKAIRRMTLKNKDLKKGDT